MATDSSTSVLIVVDGECGDGLYRLVGDRPIWITASPTNLSVVEELRRTGRGESITTFRDDPTCSRTELFAAIVPTIDLHHGSQSQNPPYQRLEVVGAKPNQAAKHALDSIGFRLELATPAGFIAVRSAV